MRIPSLYYRRGNSKGGWSGEIGVPENKREELAIRVFKRMKDEELKNGYVDRICYFIGVYASKLKCERLELRPLDQADAIKKKIGYLDKVIHDFEIVAQWTSARMPNFVFELKQARKLLEEEWEFTTSAITEGNPADGDRQWFENQLVYIVREAKGKIADLALILEIAFEAIPQVGKKPSKSAFRKRAEAAYARIPTCPEA